MPEPEATPAFPDGWTVLAEGKHVETRVRTKDFLSALALFQRIGEIAEKLDHHPDLHLEGYRNVRIVSTSHDVGRLTRRDAALAREVEALLAAEGWRAADAHA